MLFSQANGRRVVGLTEAEVLGSLAALSVASAPARVTALKLKGRGPRDVLAWRQVESFGPDAVTVRAGGEGGDDVQDDEFESRRDPMGKPVITEDGHCLGKIVDVEFDGTTGRVQRLMATDEEIAGERLLGVGGYAVVVRGG